MGTIYHHVGYEVMDWAADVHRCDCLPLPVVCVHMFVHVLLGFWHTHTHPTLPGRSLGWISVICEITVRCWIMINLWISHCCVSFAQPYGSVRSIPSQFLICAPLTKTTHRVNLKDLISFFLFLYAVVPQHFLKIDTCYFCVSPAVRLVFSAPLGVLRDFCCSLKAAASPMARPSRAIIQTYRLREYKSCLEFALAGSSSRSHRDYFVLYLI